MQESASRAPQETPHAELALSTIWQVQADASYDVRRVRQAPAWIVVRTLGGMGRITIGKRSYDVGADTLFLADLERIRRYRCLNDSWRFWWFELSGMVPDTLQKERVLSVPAQAGDDETFRQCFLLLRREDLAERRLALAWFQVLLQRWLAWQSRAESKHPHREALEAVIDAMHDHLDQPWTVSDMAALAHLSERRFRQVFADYTGTSPKKFYDGLRLAMGRDLLRQGIYTVSEVADRLGFSSPFHFSRAFSQRFSVPPSEVG